MKGTLATAVVAVSLMSAISCAASEKDGAEAAPWRVGDTFECTVEKEKDVADADSFTCREARPDDPNQRIEVRLFGVNGVEFWQPGYQVAKRFARKLYVGETFSCRVSQPYMTKGRIAAICKANLDLGKLLVLGGFVGDCPAFSGGAYKQFEPKPWPHQAGFCQP